MEQNASDGHLMNIRSLHLFQLASNTCFDALSPHMMQKQSVAVYLWTVIGLSTLFWRVNCEHVPKALEWLTECDEEHDFCGVLHFCHTGATFGYILPGQSCTPGPGPIIRLQPGNRYKVMISNDADVSTNLHAHGLHISGSGDGDDVTRHVAPGRCITYSWDIDSDHPAGTFWYHAHLHGITATQVESGAYGMLIVEDEIGKPGLSHEVRKWQQNEKILLVTAKRRTYHRRHGGHGEAANGNGVSNDQFEFVSNEWYRLRVAIVDAAGHAKDLKFGSACKVHLVARDGIWSSSVPGPAVDVFELPGSARADFAVQCFHVGESALIEFDGTVVATISVVQGHRSGATPYENGRPWRPQRSDYLQDTRSVAVPEENTYLLNTTEDSINGITWAQKTPHKVIAFGEVHEWTILMSHHHPFHLHVYHMQVVSPDGCGTHQYGEWYDTIAAHGPCTVRFRTADVGERVVFHCHVLEHEDGGAMGWVDVQGPGMKKNDGDGSDMVCTLSHSGVQC